MYTNHNTTGGAAFASAIEALGAKSTSPNNYEARCPLHNDRTPSLRITLTKDKPLLKCFAGCDQKTLWRYFIQLAEGVTPSCHSYHFENVPEDADEWKAAAIQRVWSEGQEISEGDPVHTYLTVTRRIPLKVMPADLRYHSESRARLEDNIVHTGPSMIAAVRNPAGAIVQVHRTFLTEDGRKADIPSAKRLMPSPHNGITKGCAIRLGSATETLVVAEGIETALAASHLSGYPAWSCISAEGLKLVEIPERISTVRIAIDNDPTCEEAASLLTQRLLNSNKQVILVKAPGKGKGSDWADVIRSA